MADWGKLYDKGTPAQQAGGGNLIQNLFGGAKSLGLGAIQDIMAPTYLAAQEIGHGQSPIAGVGNQPTAADLNTYAQANPFANKQQLQQMGGVKNAGQDLAGAASWMVPETKIAKGGILASLINRGAQGAIQGALGNAATGNDIGKGALTGAVANPVMGALGNAVTSALPRYIGLRNFGAAGLNLPEVVKAENNAAANGFDSLQAARSAILKNVKPFDFLAESGSTQDRQALLNKINDLANSDTFRGTPGLSDLVKRSKDTLPQLAGDLPDVKSQIQNATDPWDAYTRLKNMADWGSNAFGNNPKNKLAQFLKSAAGVARQHLIDTSENPSATAKAMNDYAAQTAMKFGKGVGGNAVTNMLAKATTGGLGEAGLAGLAAVLPIGLHAASVPLALDTALTNSVTGPSLARGLVTAGEKAKQMGISDLLTRLGVAGALGLTNGQSAPQQTTWSGMQ